MKLFLAIFIFGLMACKNEEIKPIEPELYTVTYKDSVRFKLPEKLLDLQWNELDSLTLYAGTGKILLKDLNKDPSQNQLVTLNKYVIRKGKSIRLGGYLYNLPGSELSVDNLDWVSENLDVLALHPNIEAYKIKLLKKKNPTFKFYIMRFATSLSEPTFIPSQMNAWTVKNKKGEEALGVRRKSDDSSYHLMDLGNEDYANWFKNYTAGLAEEYGADGVFIDEIMWNGYWNLDVRDMRDYTTIKQITDSCYDWLKIVKENNPYEIITQAFWPDALQYQDGVWGEQAFKANFRDGEYDVFYQSSSWKNMVNLIKTLGGQNKTYLWAGWYLKGDERQLEYCLATYLMGKNGDSVVFQPQPIDPKVEGISGYHIENYMQEVEVHRKYFNVELGQPLGLMKSINVQNSVIWYREFENGYVYCNNGMKNY